VGKNGFVFQGVFTLGPFQGAERGSLDFWSFCQHRIEYRIGTFFRDRNSVNVKRTWSFFTFNSHRSLSSVLLKRTQE